MPNYTKFDPNIPQDMKKYNQLKNDATKVIKAIEKKDIINLTPFRENPKPENKSNRADNWSNIMTGLGQRFDKSRYTTFSGYEILDDQMLSELWVSGGFAHKITAVRCDDMTRQWIKIENDPDNDIINYMKNIDTKYHINLGLKWRSHFGGGINVLGINDGGKLEEEVNINKIKSIDWLETYDRTDCSITEFHYNKDKGSANFGELEYITIQPPYGTPFNAHVSRCLIWKGIPVPKRIESGNFYFWGMSELQHGWNELKNLCASFNHIVKILYEFIIGKYKIDGLQTLISEGKKQQVDEILGIIELAKSTIQGVLLDSQDDYQRDSANVSGLSDLLDRYMIMLAGVYDYPVTKLFGRSAAGENATGEGDLKNYYDSVKSYQENLMSKNLMKLINYVNIALKNKIQEPNIIYNSLFQLTQKEELECKKLQAEQDQIYINTGVLTPDEVAENRFGGDSYSYDTTIDLLNRESEMQMENEELKRQMEELKMQQLNNNQNNNLEEIKK